MNNNPWLVESIQDFYFLKCPECDFDSKEENSFQDHAVENHPLSFVFFMKSEPANINNMLEVSILQEEVDPFENSIGIKQEYHEGGIDYYSEPIKYETQSIEDVKDVMKREPVNQTVKNKVHEGKKPHVCSICGSSFTKAYRLKLHISTAHEGNAVSCSVCEKIFKAQEYLVSHIKRQKCKGSPVTKQFTEISEEGTEFFQCSKCNIKLETKQGIKVHILSVHKGKNPYVCSFCNVSFSQISQVKNHIALKHGEGTPLKCPDCDYACETKKQLKKHIQADHPDKKPCLCSQCGLRFMEKHALKSHIEEVHEEKKPHMCSICGTSYSRPFRLKQHISSVHEGNKPFLCSICDYRCAEKSTLEKHVGRIHEKKKPHNCTICERSFFTKVALNRHTLAVHEKQKNFNCHLCNLSFSIKCNLKRHILSVHEKVKVKKTSKKESKLIDQVLIQN